MTSGYFDNIIALSQADHLEAMIVSSIDAIIALDARQRIICFNPAAERMFGLPASKALGQPIKRFIPDVWHADADGHVRIAENDGAMDGLRELRARRANGETFPVEATLSHGMAGSGALATIILRDITQRQAHDRAQTLLAREVDHRAKNVLAVVSSLITLTRATTRDAYVAVLKGRIAALSRAHSLLEQRQWEGAPLERVIRDELDAHAEPGKYSCVGPPLHLTATTVQPVGMLLHELSTNAVKYGALSVPEGHVYLTWDRSDNGSFWLCWREGGGPAVEAPATPGFGTNLIRQIIESQLGGTYRAHWDPEGYGLMMSLPDTALHPVPDAPPTPRRRGAATAPGRRPLRQSRATD